MIADIMQDVGSNETMEMPPFSYVAHMVTAEVADAYNAAPFIPSGGTITEKQFSDYLNWIFKNTPQP